MHTAPSLPSLLRTTGLIKLKKGAPGVVALLLQYWSPPHASYMCPPASFIFSIFNFMFLYLTTCKFYFSIFYLFNFLFSINFYVQQDDKQSSFLGTGTPNGIIMIFYSLKEIMIYVAMQLSLGGVTLKDVYDLLEQSSSSISALIITTFLTMSTIFNEFLFKDICSMLCCNPFLFLCNK